jgi:hypothetical protein
MIEHPVKEDDFFLLWDSSYLFASECMIKLDY